MAKKNKESADEIIDSLAKDVGATASTAVRPAKRATPNHAPSSSPRAQAMAQAVALTDRDRATMASKVGSGVTISCSAVNALSVKLDMLGVS